MSGQNRRHLDPTDEGIVRELYPSLRRFAAVTGDADMDPDDLVQEALLRVLRTGGLRDLQHPGAYVRTTILRLVANERRRLMRQRGALRRLRPERLERPSYPSDLAELMRLPAQARAVLYLRDVEGQSYQEVAGVVGISEEAARATASRWHRRLRRVLEVEVGDATA